MAVELHIDIDEVLAGLNKMRLDAAVSKPQFRRIVSKELAAARRDIAKDAKGVMKHDPRQAWKGVKTVTYKRKTLGGLLAILEPRGKVYRSNYRTPKKVRSGKVGGNRAPAHPDYTIRRGEYWGQSRSFVLRFLNGTNTREAGRFTGKFRGANRGRISQSDGWFDRSAYKHAEEAVTRIGDRLREAVTKNFDEG